jgi:predicted RecA/RadA family phage recombinase
MATNYQQDGNVINWTNGTGADVAAGDVVKMQNMLGVALVDIADDATGAVAVEGVFSGVPKVSAAVFAVGEKLVFDVSATPPAFDDSSATPATGDVTGGAVAWAAGANLETTCTIRLTPGNTTVT